MRNQVRSLADTETDKEKKKELFKLGDEYRKQLFDKFSVKIEDKTNLWKVVEKTDAKKIKEVLPPCTLYENEGPLEKFKSYVQDE